MWESTKLQNVYKSLISKAIFKNFQIVLTKHGYIVEFSNHIN